MFLGKTCIDITEPIVLLNIPAITVYKAIFIDNVV